MGKILLDPGSTSFGSLEPEGWVVLGLTVLVVLAISGAGILAGFIKGNPKWDPDA